MASMSFDVAAGQYDRFIGRYSEALAPRFIAFAGVEVGPVLDVGCGPGSLTAALASRLGAARVSAVDPSAPFVAACRARVPGADVRAAGGEALPFADRSFEAALAQLVLSFVREPDRFMAELVRVVRPGGVVAACTFEAQGFELVRTFWEAARRFDPAAPDDASLPFRREGELTALFERSGLGETRTGAIEVEARYASFEELWRPLEAGIGPAAGYLVAQTAGRQSALHVACRELLGDPSGPFTLPARIIAVRGRTGPAR
jgi:SAM-dependent methyltransferase